MAFGWNLAGGPRCKPLIVMQNARQERVHFNKVRRFTRLHPVMEGFADQIIEGVCEHYFFAGIPAQPDAILACRSRA